MRRAALIGCVLVATVLVGRAQKPAVADLKTTPEATRLQVDVDL